MRYALILLGVVACAACGRTAVARHASTGTPPVSISADGRGVLRDAYDGKLDRSWTCGSLRAAVARLPSSTPSYTRLPMLVEDAAARTCDGALRTLGVGSTASMIRTRLGPPQTRGRCWTYRWPPSHASAVDGARFCFAKGEAALAQTSVHG